MLCNSLMLHDGVLTAEKSIKLSPDDDSALGIRFGDRIALSEADFSRLAAAFFVELEGRFSERAAQPPSRRPAPAAIQVPSFYDKFSRSRHPRESRAQSVSSTTPAAISQRDHAV